MRLVFVIKASAQHQQQPANAIRSDAVGPIAMDGLWLICLRTISAALTLRCSVLWKRTSCCQKRYGEFPQLFFWQHERAKQPIIRNTRENEEAASWLPWHQRQNPRLGWHCGRQLIRSFVAEPKEPPEPGRVQTFASARRNQTQR